MTYSGTCSVSLRENGGGKTDDRDVSSSLGFFSLAEGSYSADLRFGLWSGLSFNLQELHEKVKKTRCLSSSSSGISCFEVTESVVAEVWKRSELCHDASALRMSSGPWPCVGIA